MLLVFLVPLVLLYAALMVAYRRGWDRTPVFKPGNTFVPQTRVAVIVPARNEEDTIEACLRSLLAQSYPKELLQIVMVDDSSDDDTAGIAEQLGVTVIRMAQFPPPEGQAFKKYALQKGIEAVADAELIVTTDADCTAGPQWIQTLAAFYQKEAPAAIIAPVRYHPSSDWLDIFQTLDFASMQGITAAVNTLGIGTMANGANLAFSRKAFEAVGGYEGTTHLATGDDYLLFHKLQEVFGEKVKYLKARKAIVSTMPQPDMLSFFQQRIRWASKSGKYKDTSLTVQLLLVYALNLALLVAFFVAFTPALSWGAFLFWLAVKAGAEYYFLEPVLRYYRLTHLSVHFLLLQPLHIFYVVLAGFLSFRGKYEWKSRMVG